MLFSLSCLPHLATRIPLTVRDAFLRLPWVAQAIAYFLDGDQGDISTLGKAEQQLLDLATKEFVIRDFSERLDESAVKYLPLLRQRLAQRFSDRPSLSGPTTPQRQSRGPERSAFSPLAPTDMTPPILTGACLRSAGEAALPELAHFSDRARRARSAFPSTYGAAGTAATGAMGTNTGVSQRESKDYEAQPIGPKSPLVFLHIPKTAGTNLNLQLRTVAESLKHIYCEVRTTDAHRKLPSSLVKRAAESSNGRGKGAKARAGCGIVSGEFDVSILTDFWPTFNLPPLPAPVPPVQAPFVPRDSGVGASIDSGPGGDVDGFRIQTMTFLRDPIKRTLSQFEHHVSRKRYPPPTASELEQDARALMDVVSPSRCHQFIRDQTSRCHTLTNYLKCRSNGWCGLFQNHQVPPLPTCGVKSYLSPVPVNLTRNPCDPHQVEILAGAMSFRRKRAQALRRSSSQLLCSATANLQMLTFFGLTEFYDLSLCLFFHTFHMEAHFQDCCRPAPALDGSTGSSSPRCSLFHIHTRTNSAQDGKRLGSSHGKDHAADSASYSETYTSHPSVLKALFEGNRLDCELYATALSLFRERIGHMERARGLPSGTFGLSLNASSSSGANGGTGNPSLCLLAQHHSSRPTSNS